MIRRPASIVLALSLAAGTASASAPPWIDGGKDPYAAARARGKKDGKPIVLFVFDDDDSPFIDTDKSFEDPSLDKLHGDFVFVKVDSESEIVCKKLHQACDNAPWVFVLDPRAKEPSAAPLAHVVGAHRKGGGIPAAKLAETLSAGLAKYKGR